MVVQLINISTRDTFNCYRVDSIPKNSGFFSAAKNTLYACSFPKNNAAREVFEETGIIVKVKSLIGIYSNTRRPSILNMDFLCEYVSGEPATSAESSVVEWVEKDEVLSRVQRKVISKRLKNMLEFTGKVSYGAYFVDPFRLDLGYKDLEDRKI